MDNDIELYSNNGGGVAPYAPSQPLAPAPSPDTWGNNTLTPREIDDYQKYTGGGQMVFGQPLPPGVSIAQVKEGYKQLGDVFSLDFMKLGYSISQTQKCVSWFMNAISNPPAKEQKRHPYRLYEHENDILFQSFANFASDNNFSAKLVSDICWWVTEAGKRLQAQQVSTSHVPAKDGSNSGRPDDLDTATYNRLYDYNEKMRPRTEAILCANWGEHSYQMNRRMVDEYLQNLPLVEQEHFDRFLNNGLHALNDPTVILGLFNQAIGHGNLPVGAALAAEIAEHEAAMRGPNRKKWMNDERMGARYRELIMRRDGR